MTIEDTFGYRFVRISLVLLNCLVLVRLVSMLLQYSHIFEPAFVLFILLIGSNFMVAIIGAIREHRIAVLLTGSITLIMFLSLLFTNKENKSVNVSLFTLLAIAAQSLIFSEMLKERQLYGQQNRPNFEYFGANQPNANSTNGPLAAVVVYQTPAANRNVPGGIFMVDPILGTELPKDPPPSYFAANCPPPKYEDAIKINNQDQTLPVVTNMVVINNNNNPQQQESNQPSSSTEAAISNEISTPQSVDQQQPHQPSNVTANSD